MQYSTVSIVYPYFNLASLPYFVLFYPFLVFFFHAMRQTETEKLNWIELNWTNRCDNGGGGGFIGGGVN